MGSLVDLASEIPAANRGPAVVIVAVALVGGFAAVLPFGTDSSAVDPLAVSVVQTSANLSSG